MIERVTQPDGWNEAALKLDGDFLQSWQWGEFQRSLGRDVLRLREDGAMAQLVRMPLPLGKSYWYSPRGPLGRLPSLAMDADLKQALFLRVEPQKIDPSASLGMTKSVKVRDVQPGQTLIVDLNQDQEALLAAMHEKWRYNIRLAERKGVRLRQEKMIQRHWMYFGISWKRRPSATVSARMTRNTIARCWKHFPATRPLTAN
jgi:lipid II:glycine glycyltransferase (peptidoglycan interpeptide bridge formation enzyme)